MVTTKQYDNLNRLAQISNTGGTGSTLSSFTYTYNDANQRVRVTLADGSYWLYEYDRLGQVIAGRKYWSDGTPVAGQQFEYGFDDIGNRKVARRGGDENGWNLRQSLYTANLLNQYTQRTVPGFVDIIGIALATNPVYVNGQMASRKGEYFRRELSVNNATAPVWQSVTVTATGETPVAGNVFVPKTPEPFSYDLDGNMTSDGRWNYTWDAENRLVKVESRSDTPQASWRRVEWTFDALGRRIRQTTWMWNTSSGTWQVSEDLKFVSDPVLFGRHIVELRASDNTLVRSYVWGLDLSGTLEGAGGVGGLLMVCNFQSPIGTHFAAHDGNGNVVALVSATTGTETARYEYGPFGEPIRVSGPAAQNPFRFSTKRTCNTTDLVLYEYRAYSPSLGRWLRRDVIGEARGLNRYALGWNDGICCFDVLGLYVEAPPSPRPVPAPPEVPPKPNPVPRKPPIKTPRVGPGTIGLCIVVGGISYCIGEGLGEWAGIHDELSDAFARAWDKARCVLCRHRHPTWPRCRKGDPQTPEEAMADAIARGWVPTYWGFNGPYFMRCQYEAPAHGCRGMANRDMYLCKAAYWSQWTAHVTVHYYTVITCGCCFTFSEGTYAVFKHRSGPDKTSPPEHY